MKHLFFHSLVKYIIITVLSIVFILAYLMYYGFELIINYCNAFFIFGAFWFFIGCLSICSYFGIFNSFSYAFSYLGVTRIKEQSHKKLKGYYQYINDSRESKRQSLKEKVYFMPYFVIGTLLILVGVFLQIFIL